MNPPPTPPTERAQLDALIPAMLFIVADCKAVGVAISHWQLLQRLRDIDARARDALRDAGVDVE